MRRCCAGSFTVTGFDAREIIERLTFVATKMPRGTSEGEGEAIALLDQARPEGMMES